MVVLNLFFITSFPLECMDGLSEACKVCYLDLLPDEVINTIIDKTIPIFFEDGAEEYYEIISDALNFVSTCRRYHAFELELSNALERKKARKREWLTDATLAVAIEKNNLRVSRILIDSKGTINLYAYITKHLDRLCNDVRLKNLRLLGTLLNYMHDKGQSIDTIIAWEGNSVFRYLVNPKYLFEERFTHYLVFPVKVFLNSVKDNKMVLSKILSAPTSSGPNALIHSIGTNEPELVSLIFDINVNNSELIKKLLEDQSVKLNNSNALQYAINSRGNIKIIEMLLEAGQRVQSNHLTQKTEDGRAALDCADDEETKELIKEYLHK